MKQPTAKTAIKILSDLLENTDPAMLAYWVTPNTILTLCGARAFCDGLFYSDNEQTLKQWTSEIGMSAHILKSITEVGFFETKIDKTSWGEPYASYDLVLLTGLNHVLHNSKLLPVESTKLGSKQLSVEQLVDVVATQLVTHPMTKGYNAENLRRAAFGILVGYPDVAIIGAVTKWKENDPFAEPLIDADIRGAGYYLCPQPIYSYPRHLVNDKTIKANEQLWSAILREFYTSDFHNKLANNPQFKRKAMQLGLYP